MQLKHIKTYRMNKPIIETYQIVQENTSKDPKRIKSSIYDTVYFKIFITALKTENIQFYRHEDLHGETIYIYISLCRQERISGLWLRSFVWLSQSEILCTLYFYSISVPVSFPSIAKFSSLATAFEKKLSLLRQKKNSNFCIGL